MLAKILNKKNGDVQQYIPQTPPHTEDRSHDQGTKDYFQNCNFQLAVQPAVLKSHPFPLPSAHKINISKNNNQL